MKLQLVSLAAVIVFAADGRAEFIGGLSVVDDGVSEANEPDADDDVQAYLNNIRLKMGGDTDSQDRIRRNAAKVDPPRPKKQAQRVPARRPVKVSPATDRESRPDVSQAEAADAVFTPDLLPGDIPPQSGAGKSDPWKGLENQIMTNQRFGTFGGEEATTGLTDDGPRTKTAN